MNEKIKELLKDINEKRKIDLLDLHREWEKQSIYYGEYSDVLSDLSIEKDMIKKEIDRLYAKLDLDFRRKKRKNNEKFVESEVRSSIENDKYYIKKWDMYFEISKIVGRLNSAVKSLDQKKKALENEVQLYRGGYFSTPKESKASIELKNEIIKEKQNKQRILLNKK